MAVLPYTMKAIIIKNQNDFLQKPDHLHERAKGQVFQDIPEVENLK